MNKGGRPTDAIWEHFLKVDNKDKPGSKYAKCKHCGNVQLGKVERLKKHILSCQSLKKKNANEINNSEIVDSNLFNTIVNDCEASNESVMPSKRIRYESQLCLDSHIVKTSKGTAESLDLLVAKFFYATNIAFTAVEHQTFKELISTLRPGYSPPSRKALAGELLDKVSAEVLSRTKKCIEGKQVTLVEDGWSNIHNDPVIATCLHSEGRSFFLDSIEAKTNTKNAEYHKGILKDAILKAKEKFNCDVKAVVTDNARVMEKAKDLLCEEDNTLVVYGCSAHYLNLLGQDVTPSQVLQHIVKVQKFFRNHHIPSALLKEIPNTVKPQLPGDTRWKSQLTCIESFHRNKHAYMQIIEENEHHIDKDVSNIIRNYNLYKQSKDLLLQLKPIADALDRLQSDTATLDEACRVWLSLLKDENLQSRHQEVSKRLTQSLQTFHYLAYLLNPKYKGEGLTDKQKESARSYLTERYPESISLLIAYEAEATPFPGTYFTETGKNMNPITWWTAIEKSFVSDVHSKECCKFIIQLLSCPASSASIERMFSNFGVIHSKLRNRLGMNTTAKLVMCYRMLRGPVELDY